MKARPSRSVFPGGLLLISALASLSLFVALSRLYGQPQREGETYIRFLREYRQAIARLKKIYDGDVWIEARWGRSNAQTASTEPPADLTTPVLRHSISLIRSGDLGKIRYKDDGNLDRVLVDTGDRSFMIRRSSPDNPYFLEEHHAYGDTRKDFHHYQFLFQYASFCPAGMGSFPEFVNSPEFKILEMTRTNDGGESLVRISFEYPNKDGKLEVSTSPHETRVYRDVSGFLVLDSARGFVIRDYDVNVGSVIVRDRDGKAGSVPQPVSVTYRSVGSVRYKDGSEPPAPSEINERSLFGKGRKWLWRKYELSKFELTHNPAEPEEFSLAAYGLGDFERPSKRSANYVTYYILAVASAAFLISYILLRIGRYFQHKSTNRKDAGM